MILLNALQVGRMLKANPEEFYIHHYETVCTIHDRSGDELESFSNVVFNRMILKGTIEKVSDSKVFWSQGYFKLKVL